VTVTGRANERTFNAFFQKIFQKIFPALLSFFFYNFLYSKRPGNPAGGLWGYCAHRYTLRPNFNYDPGPDFRRDHDCGQPGHDRRPDQPGPCYNKRRHDQRGYYECHHCEWRSGYARTAEVENFTRLYQES